MNHDERAPSEENCSRNPTHSMKNVKARAINLIYAFNGGEALTAWKLISGRQYLTSSINFAGKSTIERGGKPTKLGKQPQPYFQSPVTASKTFICQAMWKTLHDLFQPTFTFRFILLQSSDSSEFSCRQLFVWLRLEIA